MRTTRNVRFVVGIPDGRPLAYGSADSLVELGAKPREAVVYLTTAQNGCGDTTVETELKSRPAAEPRQATATRPCLCSLPQPNAASNYGRPRARTK